MKITIPISIIIISGLIFSSAYARDNDSSTTSGITNASSSGIILASSVHKHLTESKRNDANPTGAEIAEKSDNRPRGEDMIFTMEMTTTKKGSGTRVRTVRAQRLTTDEGDRTMFRFTKPVDVRDTAFLMWENRTDENDMWMYLPAMRKTRRIAGSQKADSFMGTVFSNADMERRAADKDDQELLGEEKVNGSSCWKVKYTPKDNYQYASYIFWIKKDCFTPIKGEFFDDKNRMIKRLTTKNPEEIDGIATVTWMKMTDLIENRETVIEFDEIEYDTGIDSSELTRQAMER